MASSFSPPPTSAADAVAANTAGPIAIGGGADAASPSPLAPSITFLSSPSEKATLHTHIGGSKRVCHLKGFGSGLRAPPPPSMLQELGRFDTVVFDGDSLEDDSFTAALPALQVRQSTAGLPMPVLLAFKLRGAEGAFERSWGGLRGRGCRITCYIVDADEELPGLRGGRNGGGVGSGGACAPAPPAPASAGAAAAPPPTLAALAAFTVEEAAAWDKERRIRGCLHDGWGTTEEEQLKKSSKYLLLGRFALRQTLALNHAPESAAVVVWGGWWVVARELMLHSLRDEVSIRWLYWHAERPLAHLGGRIQGGILAKLRGLPNLAQMDGAAAAGGGGVELPGSP